MLTKKRIISGTDEAVNRMEAITGFKAAHVNPTMLMVEHREILKLSVDKCLVISGIGDSSIPTRKQNYFKVSESIFNLPPMTNLLLANLLSKGVRKLAPT